MSPEHDHLVRCADALDENVRARLGPDNEFLALDQVAGFGEALGHVLDRCVEAGGAGGAIAAVRVGDPLELFEVLPDVGELDGLAQAIARQRRGARDGTLRSGGGRGRAPLA